jgi:pimeloyl-ACP methyl ester carboxylesterase
VILQRLANRTKTPGRAGAVTISAVVYSSTIDTAITTLRGRIAWADGFRNRPILVMMHSYSGSNAEMGTIVVERFAKRGFFVLVPDLRGYGSSGGTVDMSAREMHDLWDMVFWARTNHADKIDMRLGRGAMVGYSDGGCHTLCSLVKFPDLFSFYAPHFPITNYAEWHGETGALFQAYLETAVGGTPGAVPNAYAARNPRDAVPYLLALGGNRRPHVWLTHDSADTTVLPHHSTDLTALAPSIEYWPTTTDRPLDQRANHGTPEPDSGFPLPGPLWLERKWVGRALDAEPWEMPPTGRVLVKGFLRSVGGWSVWLGPTSATNPRTEIASGKAEVALLDYSVPRTGTARFVLQPQTGAMRVRVENRAGVSTTATIGAGTLATLEVA